MPGTRVLLCKFCKISSARRLCRLRIAGFVASRSKSDRGFVALEWSGVVLPRNKSESTQAMQWELKLLPKARDAKKIFHVDSALCSSQPRCRLSPATHPETAF